MLRKILSTKNAKTIANYNKIFRQKSSTSEKIKKTVEQIPTLKQFIQNNHSGNSSQQREVEFEDSMLENNLDPTKNEINFPGLIEKKFYVETYGCQMNMADTEIINSVLLSNGMEITSDIKNTDIILQNTCAIRENAEAKIWHRLSEIRAHKKKDKQKMLVGVLGCMAERLKEKLVYKNQVVDQVVGPDQYKTLPMLINNLQFADENSYQINTQLSFDETYSDIMPVRVDPTTNKAFLSIMRGCNNMCSFCIVPFTRGKERSRSYGSILDEVKALRDQGIQDITLLGQNVNSYHDTDSFKDLNIKIDDEATNLLPHENSNIGFNEMYKTRHKPGLRFADLLDKVAKEVPDVRIRFTSPHPKDFPKPVLQAIAENNNICNQIHLPAQSGNTDMLFRMRRNHTREAYLELVNDIRETIPGVAQSSDFIAGFCGETEFEFQDTLSLIEQVKYDFGFLFAYSMREKTHANRKLNDDVPEDLKKQRLAEMIRIFRENQEIKAKENLDLYHCILIDGKGKNEGQLKGKTDTFRTVLIDDTKVLDISSMKSVKSMFTKSQLENNSNSFGKNFENYIENLKPNHSSNMIIPKLGDMIVAKVETVTANTFKCRAVCKVDFNQFFEISNNVPFFK